MRPWRGSWTDQAVRWSVWMWPAALVLALASEHVQFGWDAYTRWIPDLVVGLVSFGCATHAVDRNRGTAALLAAVGGSWFLANAWIDTLFVHRAVIIHLLVAYAGWRPRRAFGTVVVICGYAAALYMPGWRNELMPIALCVAAAGVIAIDAATSSGRVRRERRTALVASAMFALAILLAVSVPASPDTSMASVVRLVYEGCLCAIAVLLTAMLPSRDATPIVDLVVELDDQARSGTLRDALAEALGDDTLEVGFWDQRANFVDTEGRVVPMPQPGATRSATFVARGAQPFAVLVHDSSVLGEPLLVEAVASATRLSKVNVELQATVRDQVATLTASRRRLVSAADDERRRLDERLRGGAERHLLILEDVLSTELWRPDGGRVARASRLLAETKDELRQLAEGLHPRLLGDGLAPALRSLASRSPISVEVVVVGDEPDDSTRLAGYYVCSEALANAIKHSAATRVLMRVATTRECVTVEVVDDGVGGAAVGLGSGLRGLTDRVETLGGILRVESEMGVGTRVVAELPGSARSVQPVASRAAARNRLLPKTRTRPDVGRALDPHDRSHPIKGGNRS